jgi:hypothetical protein
LAAALLWAQWLTVSYACPLLRGEGGDAYPGSVEASAIGVAAVSARPQLVPDAIEAAPPLGHCAEHGPAAMDPDQPQRCKAHCQAGQETVNSQASAFDAPPLAAAAVVGLVALIESNLPPPGWARARATGPPRGAPPLYLSLRVLRN